MLLTFLGDDNDLTVLRICNIMYCQLDRLLSMVRKSPLQFQL